MNPIFPSILSTNCFDLRPKLEEMKKAGIDYIHLDIMDGHFVDNLSFGPSIIGPLKEMDFRIDSHLMVSNPTKIIPGFIEKGSDWVSFHVETEENIEDNLKFIRSKNCRAGLALNPDTSPEKIYPYLDHLDYILVMSVFPGYGGQKFIESSVEKAEKIKTEIERRGKRILIQMDGGLNLSVLKDLSKSCIDLYVIGTFLYNSERINDRITEIMKTIDGEQI